MLESRDVLRTVAESAAPDKVLIAGVGRESVKSTVELAEVAAKLQFDAVLVRTPMYYSPQMTTAAVLHHFRSVADRSPLPVLLYHIPKFVPYDFPVEVVAELAQHPNIIGIKDSSGNVARIRAIVEATQTAPRRTATVTPVFEPVTARMLTSRTEAEATFVALTELGSGVAVAAAPPVAPLKTRTKEVGFQVLGGSAGPRCSSRSKPAPPEPFWRLPPVLPRLARKSTSPGRITTRTSPAKNRSGSAVQVSESQALSVSME